jgi:hypothetical protein
LQLGRSLKKVVIDFMVVRQSHAQH